MTFSRLIRPIALAAALCAAGGLAFADPAPAHGAAGLRAKHDAIRGRLEHNGFGRPVEIESWERDNHLGGEVYAIVQYPYSTVEGALDKPGSWCEVLILPFNTKYCSASRDATQLKLRIGRKAEQAPKDAYPLDFSYRVTAHEPDYLRVELAAPTGPLGTRDYSITLEATPLDERRSFIRLGYTYGFGAMSRFAMQAYLSTVGANKVGFTVVGHESDGAPRFVGGLLGATERNTMRYFLAIEAYLASLQAPQPERLARRLEAWFSASERYPRQLHEMDRGEYLALKQREARGVNAELRAGA
jgi:hypothetical protein